VRLIQLFALARGMASRSTRCDARGEPRGQADRRRHPRERRANALFLEMLTSRDPETVLRWMNEAGVFGRFVPDFGRVVAQMQFDMYHHYTVDEHRSGRSACSRGSSAASCARSIRWRPGSSATSPRGGCSMRGAAP
jgi:hypothetical protein